MEFLDVLDENGYKTGKIKSYEDVHRDGDWHKSVHLWILNSQNELLMQQRSFEKKSFPGLWDMSVAGHLQAGEDGAKAAIREAKEELYIDLSNDKLEFLFTYPYSTVQSEGKYINNCFHDVYIVKKNIKPEEIKFDQEETADFKFMTIRNLKQMVKTLDPNLIIPDSPEYPKLFSFLEKMEVVKIYPPKLKAGDEVRIIAPATSLSKMTDDDISKSLLRFEELGLKITFSKHAKEIDEFRSSSVEHRLEDLYDAFLDPNVKAIITATGGYNCNRLLLYIDWDIIKNNPKIFGGFSDITALSNAIFAKTGLVTYSSPSFSSLGSAIDDEYDAEYFKKCLFPDEPFEIESSDKWDDKRMWANPEDRKWLPNDGMWDIREGRAEGTIIGGNLCTLNLLQGTEYMPSLQDSILFLEEDATAGEYTDVEFERNLVSLTHLPDFHSVKGLVIGRFQKNGSPSKERLTKMLSGIRELNSLPIIANADFGHTNPKITFPIGGAASVEVKGNESRITILEH